MGAHLGKVDDLVEFLVELLARHAKDGGININVLAALAGNGPTRLVCWA
jgi:hypothetical protein